MRTILLIGISIVISTSTWRASAQSEPVPPGELIESARRIAGYFHRNYILDPDPVYTDKDVDSGHNKWWMAWCNSSEFEFVIEYDLESKMFIGISDCISYRANQASRKAGALISVTADQANTNVQNLHKYLQLEGDWRAVYTFLSTSNNLSTTWVCNYSLYVNGFYSRQECIVGKVNAYSGLIDGWNRT